MGEWMDGLVDGYIYIYIWKDGREGEEGKEEEGSSPMYVFV